jgi:SAM-dependent methyltransferase
MEEVRFFSNLIGNSKKKRVLDIGAAEGKLSLQLALNGHDVTACDISNAFLKKAMTLCQEFGVSVRFEKCDIEGSGLQIEEKFDVIFFLDVIEHLKNPINALVNIHGLLSKNGTLFIHTPNSYKILRILQNLTRKKMNYYDARELWDLHFQTYDYFTLEKTLNFVGFKSTIIPTKITLPFASSILGKFLAQRYPSFSDTLLLKCYKHEPINIDEQINHWSKHLDN